MNTDDHLYLSYLIMPTASCDLIAFCFLHSLKDRTLGMPSRALRTWVVMVMNV